MEINKENLNINHVISISRVQQTHNNNNVKKDKVWYMDMYNKIKIAKKN